jgi:hypothetical protein
MEAAGTYLDREEPFPELNWTPDSPNKLAAGHSEDLEEHLARLTSSEKGQRRSKVTSVGIIRHILDAVLISE